TNDVTQLYVTLLHRSPDPVGLADWVDECVKGMSVADMTTAFKKSCEYVGKQKTGYVDTATRTLIGGWATQNVDISIDGHVVAAGVRTSGKRADVIAVMGCSRTYGFNYVPPSLSAGAHTVSATISGTKVALPSSGQALTIPAL
ncbi:MAG TPA: DUF4214 domain-containing protein, partial [Elusimicrobiota bacterium]|nr:DUF4214 domain-containing protein [Elusimicrobiota bacterium]